MKKLVLTLLFAALTSNAFASAKIDPYLLGFIENTKGNEAVSVLALMEMGNEKLPRKYDSREIYRYLAQNADRASRQVLGYLQQAGTLGTAVKPYHVYWINSVFTAVVTREGLRSLAQAPGVTKIYANRNVMMDRPVSVRSAGREEVPYDLVDVRLDKLLAENPKLTGDGVVLGQIDTGVDGKHAAVAGKIKLFFDVTTGKIGEPKDTQGHGTHTAGTILGTGKDGTMLGMAPGAKLISAGPLASYDGMLAGMQWMLNPDGNAGTQDFPRAISNSWNTGGAPDQEVFYRAIKAWETSGILPVFSAGNSGPNPQTITPPHEYPGTLAVGATGKDGKIASFSSRGPGVFQGQKVQKPDLTAPGVDVVSSVPGGTYKAMSGTSMACPHVAGATAILFQILPNLTPEKAKQILMQTAAPRDLAGNPSQPGVWNANYGLGKLDIYAAAHFAHEISVRMNGGFRGLKSFFMGPDEIQVESILREVPEYVDFSYPENFEGSSWLEYEEIWSKK